MARIFYSMAGEGRGHAARVRSVVEHLRHTHDLHLFCPGDAYDFLAPLYAGTEVRVEHIPGLRFAYRGEQVDYARTVTASAKYVARLPRLVHRLMRRIERRRPDFAITDFEPSLPRAARRAGLPFISVSHQHFLVTNDLSVLPRKLRWWARLMGLVVRGYYRGQAATVSSSFYSPPVRPSARDAHQVGVLLRPELRAAHPTIGEHLLAYVRRSLPSTVEDALLDCGREVRVYGLGVRGPRRNLVYRPISERGFLDDLRSCAAVVSTAGNQLVGEALSLEKPVLAIPEPGNKEQEINGWFLAASGAGHSVASEDFGSPALTRFLSDLDHLRERARAGSWDGTTYTLDLLQRFASQPQSTTTAGIPAPLDACALSTS